MSTEFYARQELFNDSISIYARRKGFGGMNNPVAAPMQLMFVDVPEHSPQGPMLELHGNDGRALFQAMWDAGMRPNNGAGSGAEAQALKDHVQFAERIADGLLALCK